MGSPHEGSIRRPIAPWANALTTELHLSPLQNNAIMLLDSYTQGKTRVMFPDTLDTWALVETLLTDCWCVTTGAGRSSEVDRSLMVRWVVGSILHVVDPLSYFSFQPVLHNWCNKGRGMCYPVCGMVHIKEPLLLIDEKPMWRQRVSFLTIRMVLNHVWRHITVDKMCWVRR